MSRPSHEVVLATVRDFTDRSGATRVTVVLDLGADVPPPLIECEPGEPPTVNEEHVVPITEFAGAGPLFVPAPKPVPATAIDADPQTGEVAAPIGVLEGLADAVAGLATALGGRTVAIAEFATRNGDALSIAARPGEPVVLAIGEQQFQFPG
jgi:hypothetical protein